jgi:hypothetical protein
VVAPLAPLLSAPAGDPEEAPESSRAPSRHPYAAGGAQEATEAPEEEPRRGFFSRLFGG